MSAPFTPGRRLAPVKCLLVDDLEENLLALEALLRSEGVALLKARSAREALEALLVHDVGLAVIDVHMPEMDGFELAKLMNGTERTRHVPIIFVTAGIQDVRRLADAYAVGAVDFLFKPIEPSILKHKAETFFELYRQRQQLADTLRLNEELVAVVGHDLRNPLQAILMTADVLGRKEGDPDLQRAAARLQSSGNRMLRMIDELLDLSRARLGGGIPIQRQPANLANVAKKTVTELEASHPGRVIELHREGDLQGEWDPDRLEQVLSNLVGNALHHGAEGPIEVRLQGHEGHVTVCVRNAGAVSPDIVGTLFEPFRAGAESRARSGGLGLGLYIVKQIVLAHGGDVDVRSGDPEATTTFEVRLPRGSAALG